MKEFKVMIKLESPMHLGSGHADVVVDAEAVKDKYGMPYFPGKRLKGLLYESALEMAEMGCGQVETPNFDIEDVKALFGQISSDGNNASKLRVDNFYLGKYDDLCAGWGYLQQEYSGIFTPDDVWNSYTGLRYQTAINEETGIALDGTLHNIRAVDAGTEFFGRIVLLNVNAKDSVKSKDEQILELALLNLRYAGAKRNRGFGKIKCTFIKENAEGEIKNA